MAEIAAIILAAGRSSRFHAGPQDTKLIAPLFGKPLVRYVAEAALASRARPILVVTGHAAGKVETALDGLDLFLIANPHYQTGLSSSLKAGIAALPKTAAGAVILLADMPRISGELIDRLIRVFEASVEAPRAVAPVRGGSRGNPVLIGRGLFVAVAHLEGDRGARRLVEAGGEGVIECSVDDDAIEIDIDTRDALRRLETEATTSGR
ncbi:nucleotidyltransferase family protein [Methylocapsa polymorpha]|uniref:Nucleotidyltransferase family protein n=1 Tax=Methylocapsa polymorpha TaxID=3080828 RepID=A0ABZ0HWF6_9HYPH|nr:nucleotidyltransferase family protein [Methylocapsa sp. RX1]